MALQGRSPASPPHLDTTSCLNAPCGPEVSLGLRRAMQCLACVANKLRKGALRLEALSEHDDRSRPSRQERWPPTGREPLRSSKAKTRPFKDEQRQREP
jgi:hypothetical protein